MHQIRVRLASIAFIVAALAALQPLLPNDAFDIEAAQNIALVSPLPVLDIEPDRWLDLDATGPPRLPDGTLSLGDPPPPLLTADGTLQLHDRETGETVHIEAATNANFAHRQRLDVATGRVEATASHLVYRSTADDDEFSTLHVLDLDSGERWSLDDLPDAFAYDDRTLRAQGSDDDPTVVRFWDLRTGEPLGEFNPRGALEGGFSYRTPTTFGYSIQSSFPPALENSQGADEAEPGMIEHLLIADDFSWTLGVRDGATFIVALDPQRALTLGLVDDRWVINEVAIPGGEVSLLVHLDDRDTFPQFSDLRRPPDPGGGRHLIWHSCGDDPAAWVYAVDEDQLTRLDDTSLLLAYRGDAWAILPGDATALVDLDALEYEFALPHAATLSLDSRWLALPAEQESLPSFGLTCR